MDKMPTMDELYSFETRMLRGAMFSNIKQSVLFSLVWLLVITFITNRLFSYTILSSIGTGSLCALTAFIYLLFRYIRQYRKQVQELARARLARDLAKECLASSHRPGTFRRHVFGDQTTENSKPTQE